MQKQKLPCPFCPKISSRGTGLASHIRGAHPEHYAKWTGNRKNIRKTAVTSSSPETTRTASGLAGVIIQLELQKAAIDRALSALQDL